MPPAGVIFDMDGVLLDSGPAHAASWRILAGERGAMVSDETVARLFGRSSRDIVAALFGEHLRPEMVAELDARKEAIYRDLIHAALPVMPGAGEAVRRLAAAGMSLAVGSSGPAENIELMLDGLGVRGCFQAVVNGHEVSRGKPDPEVFLLAATRLELPPDRCLVVEDAPVGIQAAHRAGMRAVALAGTHPSAALAEADRVISSLDELKPELASSLIGPGGR